MTQDTKPKVALVTGGAGFIGSHVAEALLERGYDVIVADNLSTGKRRNVPSTARFVECDISSSEFRTLIETEQPVVLAHLAAQIDVRRSVEDPIADAATNIIALVAMMETITKTAPRCRVVLTSTAGVYGDAPDPPLSEETRLSPLSPYAISKATGERYLEHYARIHGIQGVILRFANVYGPKQDPKGEAGVVSIFCSRIRSGQPMIVYGDGRQTRDYVFVKDVAEAIARSAEVAFDNGKSITAPVFNIGTGVSTSVLDLVKKIEQISGRSAEVQFEPIRPGEIIDSSLDAECARKILGWSPSTTLIDGLRVTYSAIETAAD